MWKIIIDNINIAFKSIQSQKARAFITILIIAFGIMALVGTLSVVNAINNNFSASLQSLGSNTFSFKRYENNLLQKGYSKRTKINPKITYREAHDFKKRFDNPASTVSISYAAANDFEIKSGLDKTDPKYVIIGVDENYLKVNALSIEKGKSFTQKDIENNANFVIIGKDLVKELFNNKEEEALKNKIFIKGYRFKVIGILNSKQSTFGGSENNKILIPINIARSIFNQNNGNYSINVSVDHKENYKNAIAQAIALMRNIRKLKPAEANNFGINRSDKLEGELKKVNKSLRYFAFIIGLITILGSSIALINIMLVSVTERTREIGVRKAVGANNTLVMLQFFIETLVITIIGGLIGIFFGLLIGFAVAKLMHNPFTMPWDAIGVTIFIIFVVAIISGVYPAYKASKLDPIQALRYE